TASARLNGQLKSQVARAFHFQPSTMRCMHRPHEDAVAMGAPQDCSHRRYIQAQGAHRRHMAACFALNLCTGYLGSEDLLEKTCSGIAVQHAVRHVLGHGTCPPEGPKRSVLIVRGSCSSSTRNLDTSSTKGVGPQT